MKSIAWGILLGLISATAAAQEPVREKPPATKGVTITTGADMPLLTGYVFRGIVQEFDPKFTFQPFLDIGVAVSDTATVNVGTWNSFNTGSLKDTLGGSYYEADLYASVTLLAGNWKPGVLYTLYTSPAGGYDEVGDHGSIGVSELAFFASYDDSKQPLPFSPKVIVAFETTDTQADFGTKKGIYVELGVKPTFKSSKASKITFAVPVRLGLSAKDYYETFDGNLNATDNTFGYFQFGASVSVPLPIFPKGSWEAHGGMDVYVFGKNRKVQVEGDTAPKSVKPVLNFGFSATF